MSESDQNVTAIRPLVRGTVGSRLRRPFAFAAPMALLFLVSGCGSSDTPAATPTSGALTTQAAAGSELTGVVGEGDAFVITLKDSTGAPVTTLKAGSYTVKVKDASKIHNFHLTGTGVKETTTVPEVKDVTWKVTLVAGTYTYKCDPHAKMTGSFTVT